MSCPYTGLVVYSERKRSSKSRSPWGTVESSFYSKCRGREDGANDKCTKTTLAPDSDARLTAANGQRLGLMATPNHSKQQGEIISVNLTSLSILMNQNKLPEEESSPLPQLFHIVADIFICMCHWKKTDFDTKNCSGESQSTRVMKQVWFSNEITQICAMQML